MRFLLKAGSSTEVKVTILADRGLADQKLYALLGQLGFAYMVRFRQCIIVTSQKGERRTAAQWVPVSGRLYRLPAFAFAAFLPDNKSDALSANESASPSGSSPAHSRL